MQLLYYAPTAAEPQGDLGAEISLGFRPRGSAVIPSGAARKARGWMVISLPTLVSQSFLMIFMAALLPPVLGQALDDAPRPSASQGSKPLNSHVFDEINALIGAREFEKADGLLRSELARGVPAASAYLRMGQLYLDHDVWAAAASNFEKSIQAQDSNDQAHLLLGLAYRKLRRTAQAEEEFARAAALNPRSDVNAYFAGQQLLIDEKYELALPHLYRAVELNPRNASAYRGLGMAQVHLGNYGLAESYYRKAVDALGASDKAEPAPLLDLAFILLMGHDPSKVQEALKLAERAVKIQPDAGEGHYLVGKALMKMGRVREAVPELEIAARRNPEDSKAHFQLALAYDQLGEKAKAAAERQALAHTKQRANQQGMASGSVLPQTTP